jgi:hypothetical protein
MKLLGFENQVVAQLGALGVHVEEAEILAGLEEGIGFFFVTTLELGKGDGNKGSDRDIRREGWVQMMACCRPNRSHDESCLVLRIVTVGGLKVGRGFVAALVSEGGKVLVKSKDTFAYLVY